VASPDEGIGHLTVNTQATPAGDRQHVAGRPRGRYAHTYAAIDLGTNNCRLLVARPTAYGFRVIDAFSRIVRLGEGLQASGQLSEAAMERSLAALKVCAGKMRRRGVTRARAVATEACRKAANCAAFLDRVEAETGLRLDIISTAEEARLALAGCAPLLDYEHRHALVFDIGGGSTELLWLELERSRAPRLVGWVSLPCGVVTLAERWGGRDIRPGTYAGMIEEVSDMLSPFEMAHGLSRHVAEGRVQMLGTSGTVTTIAGVILELPRYDRSQVDGCWLDFADVLVVSRRLATTSMEDRLAHPCIGSDRADLVVAGCAILEAIHRTWPTPLLRVADRGVREGVLLDLMHEAEREGRRGRRAT
jgi:exopolyphosphatase/guanosine-5'-triphosphate,3'-diphosphate pyrophosphatase